MRTSLGKAELDRVTVQGFGLESDLVGAVTFTDMVSLLLLKRWASADERRMLDAMLVSLIEHGMIGPVVASRLIYSNSPEAIQGAVAASLLAAGSLHLGTSELAAKMLQEAIVGAPELLSHALADQIVADRSSRGERIYGVGHSVHSKGDPRADRLLDVARETGNFGRHCELIEQIGRAATERHGKLRPVNVTGALAAIASDLGLRWELAKAFALIGRTLGALAHVLEEVEQPVAPHIKRLITEDVEYVTPPSPPGDFPADRW